MQNIKEFIEQRWMFTPSEEDLNYIESIGEDKFRKSYYLQNELSRKRCGFRPSIRSLNKLCQHVVDSGGLKALKEENENIKNKQ